MEKNINIKKKEKSKACPVKQEECCCGSCRITDTEEHDHGRDHAPGSNDERAEIIKIIISAVLFIIGIVITYLPFIKDLPDTVQMVIGILIFALVIIISAFEYIIHGIKSIITLRFNETALMTIAVVAAFILGEYAEGAAVMLLFALGEVIENRATNKSKKAVSELLSLENVYASIYKNGKYETIRAEELKKGDIILIKPGAKIPGDCKIFKGSTTIDNSAVTGESVPVNAASGDDIISGCINLTSPIECEVINDYKDSSAVKINEMVKEAAAKKSTTSKFITKFSRIYTPVVLIISVAVAIVPPIIFNMSFEIWVKRALVLLVASCPCAVVISVPLAFFAGIGRASRAGVLIKGTKYIETLADIKNIAFDKTGTLTCGKMDVEDIKIYNNDYTKNEVLTIAYTLENTSTHPIAKAICNYAQKNISESELQKYQSNINNITETAGFGITAELIRSGGTYNIGCVGEKYIDENDIKTDKNNVKNAAASICYIIINNTVIGEFYLNDIIRADAPDCVNTLKSGGIKPYMLTGDRSAFAKAYADKINIERENVYAQLLPGDKSRIINGIIQKSKRKEKSGFVGDGINDAVVLASADVGIAMASGSDIASSSADVVLMNNKLSSLIKAIALSRKTMRIVYGNITFALLIKLLVFILGIIGIAPIWLAVFADAGVCVITVLISTSILKAK